MRISHDHRSVRTRRSSGVQPLRPWPGSGALPGRDLGPPRWLTRRRRMGPLVRNLRRATDPLFRHAGIDSDGDVIGFETRGNRGDFEWTLWHRCLPRWWLVLLAP